MTTMIVSSKWAFAVHEEEHGSDTSIADQVERMLRDGIEE